LSSRIILLEWKYQFVLEIPFLEVELLELVNPFLHELEWKEHFVLEIPPFVLQAELLELVNPFLLEGPFF
jgi:hypothetical protein